MYNDNIINLFQRKAVKYMKMKKIITWLTVMAMFATVAMTTGCGSDSGSSSSVADTTKAEETTQAVTEAVTEAEDIDDADDDADAADDETADDETAAYADALAGTLWVGMDTEYSCYALGFSDEEIVFAADDGSSITGYWGVTAGDPTIYIFDDAELTNEIASIPWTYDLENDVMIINDTVIMAQTDDYSFDEATEAIQQMAAAAQVEEYLQGTYWVGADDTTVSAISMDADNLEVIELDDSGALTENSFLWSMDYDSIIAYDDSYTALASFDWGITEDGSELTLTNEDGESMTYTQVSEDDAVDIVAYLYTLMGIDSEAE